MFRYFVILVHDEMLLFHYVNDLLLHQHDKAGEFL